MQAATRTAPLFPVAVGLIAGMILDRQVQCAPAAYLFILTVVSGVLLVRRLREHAGFMLLLLGAVGSGGLLHLMSARIVPADAIERLTTSTSVIARIQGRIVSPPQVRSAPDHPFQQWTFGEERTVFLLDVESIEGTTGAIRTSGLVRASVGEAVLDLRIGERVAMHGWLKALEPPRNPGSFDWSAFYRRQGVAARFVAPFRESVQSLETPSPNQATLLHSLRQTARGLLTSDLAAGADEELSLLDAMVLGHRSALDRRLNELFVRAGCAHFLAVSGIHVVIVTFFARMLAGLLGLSRRGSSWAMLLTVITYAAIAEPRPSILRAAIMASLYCVARLLGRQRAGLNWIAASVVVLAAIDPLMCFDVGYQLSFLAVLGVCYLSPAVSGIAGLLPWPWRRTTVPGEQRRATSPVDRQNGGVIAAGGRLLKSIARGVWHHLGVSLAVSLGAWLATIPVIAIYFQRVQLWGAVSTLIVFPLVGLVMGLGFTKLLVGLAFPTLGGLLAVPLQTADAALIHTVEWLSSLPAASCNVLAPGPWLMASYYGLLLALVWKYRAGAVERPFREKTGDRKPTARAPSVACCIALAAFATAMTAALTPQPARNNLIVTVLSVGAGSATVVELPNGENVLIDAGTLAPYDVGRATVVPFLRHRGISSIDRVYVSHPNLDHFSGIPSIVEAVGIGTVEVNHLFAAGSPPGSPSQRFLELLEAFGHEIHAMEPSRRRWELGGVTFERLWPDDVPPAELSANDTSTVLRLEYKGHSILFTGDIEQVAQRSLLERGSLKSDVLLLPHHGSVETTTKSFINAVGADFLIRSAHERTADTVTGLNEIAGPAPLFNTADQGAIEIVVGKDGITVQAVSTSKASNGQGRILGSN